MIAGRLCAGHLLRRARRVSRHCSRSLREYLAVPSSRVSVTARSADASVASALRPETQEAESQEEEAEVNDDRDWRPLGLMLAVLSVILVFAGLFWAISALWPADR